MYPISLNIVARKHTLFVLLSHCTYNTADFQTTQNLCLFSAETHARTNNIFYLQYNKFRSRHTLTQLKNTFNTSNNYTESEVETN